MIHEHEQCLVCGSRAFRVLPKAYQHAHLVQCMDCGLVFGKRIPTEEELAAHYGKYPRNTAISPITIKRYEQLLEKFEPYRRSNRILDIGCGDGYFLAVAKAKGWEVYGTEFTDEAVDICKEKGISMHKGIIQSWSGPHDFDVITSFEVLEHITDGRAHVRMIHELLRKGGLFYFTTPNFNSLSRKWLGGKWKIIEYPEHLCYYTPRTIHRLLSDAGLRRLEVQTTGITFRQFPSANSDYATQEEQLRTSIEGNRVLTLAKNSLNWWLSVLQTGDTLKGFYVNS